MDPHKWALETARVSKDDVVAWVEGAKGNHWWAPVFLLTEKEIVWVERGFMTKRAHRVPRASVVSVSLSEGVVWDSIVLNVLGGDLPDTKLNISRGRRNETRQLVDELRKSSPAGSNAEPQPAPSSDLDELEKLASLKDRGIITEEEFEAKKKQLLGL